MPIAQVINTARDPQQPSPVSQMFSRLQQDYKERADQDVIGGLIDQYKQNRDQAFAWEDLQLGLEKSNISPSKRLETQKSLNEMRKNIIAQDKALNEQAKKTIQESNDKKAVESLRKSGATDEQIALYEASSEGGKTKIVENVLENQKRTNAPPGIVSEEVEDFDKGLTASERVKRQDARYAVQTPLVMKNSDALKANESEGLSIDLLTELNDSDKVAEGLNNLNINPKTGDLIIPKLATAEEQLFVKTVNDFTVKAKDSFGARVSNFELDRFMQRLPTLANSKEGRALILRQMSIVNKLNSLEKRAIQGVFDKYGVRNIDYAEAENIARKSIEKEKEELRKEFLKIETLSRDLDVETVKKYKEKAQPGYVPMRAPDGSIKQFPEKNVPNLIEKGFQKL
jgi:hypothetical protein